MRFRSAKSHATLDQDYTYKASRKRARSGSRQESTDSFVDSYGNINASSKKELTERLASVIEDIVSGSINSTPSFSEGSSTEEMQEQVNLVTAAMEDRTLDHNGPMAVMGETLSDAIWETTGRVGVGRKLLIKKEPQKKGDEVRFRVRQKNVVSWVTTKDSAIPRAVVNQTYLYPEVITIPCYVTISDNEEATTPIEFMDEKFQDGLESQLVTEDKIIRALLVNAAPVFNNVYTFTNLTPALWSTMQLQVAQWGLPVPHAVMALDLWNDIRTNSDFVNSYEPVSKLQLLEEGQLGRIYGTQIYTDGLRYDTLQVYQPGEIFFCAAPIGLGGIADYSPLQSEPVSLHNMGIGARGWYMTQSSGYVVGNSRGVCWGYRSS